MSVAAAQSPDPVPVTVGGSPDGDACPTLGRVSGLNPDGDNFLAVRTGYGRVDRVTTGQLLWICGTRGGWHAVVYSRKGGDCGVSTPVDSAQPYDGPCRSGWVYSNYVIAVAG